MALCIDPKDFLMLFPIVSAGVRSKRLQMAYHLERETEKDNAIAACLKDQIEYGEWLLEQLDKSEQPKSKSNKGPKGPKR